ncbi:MAG TPA: DUF2274 domain-containing protein [Sphingomicrobium sp.]|jgi:hypothetical protein
MNSIKLQRLPDRTTVKISIAVSPELAERLAAYAEAYEAAYGQQESVADLIPFMLAGFLESDREFTRWQRARSTAK